MLTVAVHHDYRPVILGFRTLSIVLEYETIILPVVLYGCETWSLSTECNQRPRDTE
jgi:hypothetical protein